MRNPFKEVLLLASVLLFSCTSDSDFEKGRSVLEMQGYTEIKNTGWSAFCCSDNDTYSQGFSCKDKNGATVTGCICSGFGKGITIRFR